MSFSRSSDGEIRWQEGNRKVGDAYHLKTQSPVPISEAWSAFGVPASTWPHFYRHSELHLLGILPLVCHVPPDLLQCDLSMGLSNVALLALSFDSGQYTPWGQGLALHDGVVLLKSFYLPILWKVCEFISVTYTSWNVCPASLGTTLSTHRSRVPGTTFGHSWLRQGQIPHTYKVSQSDSCS